jgi:hypothetical protein
VSAPYLLGRNIKADEGCETEVGVARVEFVGDVDAGGGGRPRLCENAD